MNIVPFLSETTCGPKNLDSDSIYMYLSGFLTDFENFHFWGREVVSKLKKCSKTAFFRGSKSMIF